MRWGRGVDRQYSIRWSKTQIYGKRSLSTQLYSDKPLQNGIKFSSLQSIRKCPKSLKTSEKWEIIFIETCTSTCLNRDNWLECARSTPKDNLFSPYLQLSKASIPIKLFENLTEQAFILTMLRTIIKCVWTVHIKPASSVHNNSVPVTL